MEITKEQILEMAKWNAETRSYLEKNFPEAFDESVEVDQEWFGNRMEVRGNGKYKNKAFWITSVYDWRIEEDSEGLLCLIPTNK